MAIIGNLFALGIVSLIALAYLKNKYFITRSSKYFIFCLLFTAAAILTNIYKIELVRIENLPRTLYIMALVISQTFMVIATSVLALYLITKITEHIHGDVLLFAKIAMLSLGAVYLLLLIINCATGVIYTVTDVPSYVRGPLFFIPYVFAVLQFTAVGCYFIKYRQKLRKATKASAIESVPALLIGFALKLIYPEIEVFLLVLSMIELVFFLNFQNYLNGVNTLTKLSDGRRFLTEVEKRIRYAEPFKAYLIKIRNFGMIKQNYGHRVGDELLYQFGFSLDKLFSDGIPFHMYGTTFALVLPCDDTGCPEQTEKLCAFLEREFECAGDKVKLDCTVAERIWDDEANPDIFYEKLEYATGIAKSTNQKYVNCSLELEMTRLRQKYLISRLQNVSKENGYEIWFQPIYSTEKKTFSSAEVLLRLREKNGSFISPAEFIPLAEKTGLIVPITWFVIEETCRTLAATPELDGIRASINLPMLHLVDPEFEGRLNELVDSYGVAHERLSFEFTERVILEDLALAENNMKRLAKSGYTFYLDDFGVGYSNFNCVLRLPLKTIKLDISLTATAEKLKENYGLVKILTDLFHDMNLNVVAEGAETAEQVELLREYGIDGIQGYFFAKPMPLQSLSKFLKKYANGIKK